MIRRIGSFVALLLVATVVLAACGSEDNKVEPTVTRVPAEGAPAPTQAGGGAAAGGETPAAAGNESPAAGGETAGGPMTIDVEMVDIAFTQKEITVPANTEITVNLVNNGAATHTFDIDELNVHSGDYASGQKGTLTFNSGAPGEYEFYCAIPGHKEAGMVGKLIVTASAEPAAEDAQPAAEGAAASPAAQASPVASPVASPAAEGASAAPAGGQTTFEVDMVDIAFNPTEIIVPANSEITINLKNSGVAMHTFDIDELGVNSGEYASGQTGQVTFNSGAPGEYTYYCAVPGHKEAGMVGKLIVQ